MNSSTLIRSDSFLHTAIEVPTNFSFQVNGHVYVGPFTYQIRGLTEAWAKQTQDRFQNLWAPGEAPSEVVQRTINVVSVSSAIFKTRNLRNWSYHFDTQYQDSIVRFVGCESILSFNPKESSAMLMVSDSIKERWPRAIENALRMVMAYDSLFSGGLMLHSAAIVFGGGAHLFIGESGAGKSTLCTKAKAESLEVLSDEINLIFPTPDNNWGVYALPYAGDFGHLGKNQVHPIGSVQFIKQAHIESSHPRPISQSSAGFIANAPFINGDSNVVDPLIAQSLHMSEIFRPQTLMLTIGSKPWMK